MKKTVSTATMLQIEKNGQTTTTPKKPFCFICLQMVRRYCQNWLTIQKINLNSIRAYLNAFIQQGIIERQSVKQRDPNAKYAFRKD